MVLGIFLCLNAVHGTWNILVFKCSIQKGNLNKFSILENEN